MKLRDYLIKEGLSAKDKKEYNLGYSDGYKNKKHRGDKMNTWYSAGYTNGQQDKKMGFPSEV